ncbi:hypothetical protein [Planobispora rosea]|nr:hypothetical protein [Planobispora rosea]
MLADFLERHSDLPVPYSVDVLVFPGIDKGYAIQRAAVERLAELHDVAFKDQAGHYTASIEFGRASYRMVAISEEAYARHSALMSYQDSVIPDTPSRVERETNTRINIPAPENYGRKCECGALADKGTSLCRKCRSRSRWNRRKAPFSREGDQW